MYLLKYVNKIVFVASVVLCSLNLLYILECLSVYVYKLYIDRLIFLFIVFLSHFLFLSLGLSFFFLSFF